MLAAERTVQIAMDARERSTAKASEPAVRIGGIIISDYDRGSRKQNVRRAER